MADHCLLKEIGLADVLTSQASLLRGVSWASRRAV
jgi:hypothetical protein